MSEMICYEIERKERIMSKLLEHARNELKLAGYDIDAPDKESFESDEDYANACAKNAYKMLEVFCSEGHSGFSGNITLRIFNKLAQWKNLTPLTNNPDEWLELNTGGYKHYQSKRCSSCFSDDNLKTYYDIYDKKKTIHSLGER